jgi:hypothetical protein
MRVDIIMFFFFFFFTTRQKAAQVLSLLGFGNETAEVKDEG